MRAFLATLLSALCFAVGSIAQADTEKDILTVTVDDQRKGYTLEELRDIPQEVVITENDYLDGPARFSGPLLRDIYEDNGIERGDLVEFLAINDFQVTAPADEAFDYDVILAISKDGSTLPIRDLGPIWVIYPMSDNPALKDPKFNSRLVWQLERIAKQ